MKQLVQIGVDISDSSIKVLKLDADGNITACGNTKLEEGIIKDGLILDNERFSKTLHLVLDSTKPEPLSSKTSLLRAFLCLPESKLFTHFVDIPPHIKKTEIESFVYDDAKKIIPFDFNDLYYDYHLIGKNGAQSAVFVGAPKVNIDSYVKAFTSADITPQLISGELFSLGRALLPEDTLHEEYMIIDGGAHNTNIGVFATDSIAVLSVTVPIGGEHITSKLAEKLKIPIEKAESLKREKGISLHAEDSVVSGVVAESIRDIVETLQETKTYYEHKTGHEIKHIILAGGTALMPGFSEFLKQKTGIEVTIADPLAKIKDRKYLDVNIPALFFSNVTGLALQSNSKEQSINLLTQYRYSDSSDRKERLPLKDVRSWSDLKYVMYEYFDLVRDAFVFIGSIVMKKIKVINPKLILSLAVTVIAIAVLVWVVITYT